MKRNLFKSMKIKIKKTTLNPLIKWSIISALGIGICIFSFKAYQTAKSQDTLITELTKYIYNLDIQSDYQVNLKPNQIYEGNILQSDEIYLSELINNIETQFLLKFEGSEATHLSGNYKIDIQVAGYTMQDDLKRDLWVKTYSIKEDTFEEQSNHFTLEDSIRVTYPIYQQFVENLSKEINLNTPTEIRVLVSGEIVANTPYETIQHPIQTTLFIPLNQNYFMITSQGEQAIQESITETVTETIPLSKSTLGTYIILSLVSISLGIYIIIGTQPPTPQMVWEKKLNQIYLTYGKRMIGVNEVQIETNQKQYTLACIEDLVKVADEVDQPIMYISTKEKLKNHNFYVVEYSRVYSYSFEPLTEVKIEEKREISVCINNRDLISLEEDFKLEI